jgi:type I restriction enzyme R subunit
LTTQYPDYVCSVTADEADIGKGHLSRFQDVDTKTPTILTTSQLLTTGVDAPTCKNVVLARVIGSMTEFKQIIGRGTRVRDDYGKLWFNILDYAGSATQKFADKEFDGEPAWITETPIDGPAPGLPPDEPGPGEEGGEPSEWPEGGRVIGGVRDESDKRKFYFDGGQVTIAAHLVYELDPHGKQLRTVRYTDYAGEKVRDLVPSSHALRETWANLTKRGELIAQLEERGISFADLAEQIEQPEADPFDLLCHLAFNAPLRTRRERAQRLRSERKDLFEKYGPEARQVLDELLEKYAEHGDAQFTLPDVLHIPPISTHGAPAEIIRIFGGEDQLRDAVNELQSELYAA